jgi:hypothetical protein
MIVLHDTQTEQRSNANLVACRQLGMHNQERRLNSQEEIGQSIEGWFFVSMYHKGYLFFGTTDHQQSKHNLSGSLQASSM